MNKWNVEVIYRAVNRPNCNGIIERNHRTVKRIACRSNIDILDAVWWYNNTPFDNKQPPSLKMYNYIPTGLESLRKIVRTENVERSKFVENQLVWIKPNQSTPCTRQWMKGTVVKRLDSVKFLINCNGFCSPRHVADIRPRQPDQTPAPSLEFGNDDDGESAEERNQEPERVRPRRETRRPAYLDDFIVNGDSSVDESGGVVMENY